MGLLLMSLFCFSSRRRHTRWPRDWSSDVCSSDLLAWMIEAALDCGILDHPGQLGLGGGVVEGNGDAAGEQIGRASCRERGEDGVEAVTVEKDGRDEGQEMEQGDVDTG